MKTEIGFQDRLWFNVGQKHCRMLQESILQFFQLALSYQLSLRLVLYVFELPLKTGFTVYLTHDRFASFPYIMHNTFVESHSDQPTR